MLFFLQSVSQSENHFPIIETSRSARAALTGRRPLTSGHPEERGGARGGHGRSRVADQRQTNPSTPFASWISHSLALPPPYEISKCTCTTGSQPKMDSVPSRRQTSGLLGGPCSLEDAGPRSRVPNRRALQGRWAAGTVGALPRGRGEMAWASRRPCVAFLALSNPAGGRINKDRGLQKARQATSLDCMLDASSWRPAIIHPPHECLQPGNGHRHRKSRYLKIHTTTVGFSSAPASVVWMCPTEPPTHDSCSQTFLSISRLL